jgi:ribosomal-protein-alanine N-acetyltransferase
LIGQKISDNIFTEVQVPDMKLPAWRDCDFCSRELNRVNFYKDAKAVLQLLLEILMNNVLTFRHEIKYVSAVHRLNLPEVIETERLVLQRLKYEDAEEIFYCYASKPEATRFVSWPTHQSIRDTRDFLRYAIHGWNSGKDYGYSIRIKSSYRLIGGIGAINDQGKIQFGYVISPTQWGKGYATEACKPVLDLLRSQENVFRIGTFVDAENTASIRVLEKCGLNEEARLEKWFRFVNQGNAPKDCILFVLH